MNRQYENEGLNQSNDLFQQYIDSLEEEPAEERNDESVQQEEQPVSHLSSQVEKDLLEYKKRGYSSERRETATRTRRRARSRSGLAVFGIIAGMAAVLISSAVLVFRNVESRGYEIEQYEVEPYEYIDPWEEAYQQMSGDLNVPELTLNEHYVRLPVKVADFMQEGWKIRTSVFSENADTVGSDPASLQIEDEWGNAIAEVSVVSPTGEEVSISDALIVGLSADDGTSWCRLNGDIGTGSSSWVIEEILNEQNIEWIKRGGDAGSRYVIETETENEYGYDKYVLRMELEDDYTQRIIMQLSQSE